MATVDGDGFLISPKREERVPARLLSSLDLVKRVPKWYSSREVQIIPIAKSGKNKNPLLSTPSKVLTDNVICHFKGFTGGHKGAFQELDSYCKLSIGLATGGIPCDLCICRLHGLVCDNSSEQARIVGMLLEYIKPKITPAPSTLTNVAMSVDNEIRRCWSQELESNIRCLHRAVGGYTLSWVSPENCGTTDGDLEGLSKIKSWLSTYN
ncbi:uncharacterized protein PgNI_01471 [Pyricularia grisea]|uniref:Uncharacterized protein n=1 Tax=Pyricularia grisea TaxID=148305 RepID=A0A6P8BGN1_PYRGI|nr:uncharacterized protein PgNI_01471 [Pyricularia grisea]TLD15870.1 hypothetical protein PgNI_01471 [Pyricularia grisea]